MKVIKNVDPGKDAETLIKMFTTHLNESNLSPTVHLEILERFEVKLQAFAQKAFELGEKQK